MTQRALIFILAIGIITTLAFLFLPKASPAPTEQADQGETSLGTSSPPEIHAKTGTVSVIAENLEIPWDIAFLPEGEMLVTERPGRLLLLDKKGERKNIEISDSVLHRGEGGLLGITLHPQFKDNHLLYLYFTAPGKETQLQNRIERYRFVDDTLRERTIIIDDIPGAQYHDGGRMEFGPDGLLYVTTGDATIGKLAQDRNSLAGKILRLKDDGSIPSQNPFGTAVYSYGHRNPQGLAWDNAGRLWETEHGPTGEQGLCCRDEINLIAVGANYGWPEIQGDETRTGMVSPTFQSGADDTWAPASATYLDGGLYFGGLRGEALYEAVLNGERVVELKEYFKGEFGRIRTVRVGPDGMLYLTTSNRDGRGDPRPGDDKIIRVNPKMLP